MMKWMKKFKHPLIRCFIIWIACSITFSCWSVRRNQSIILILQLTT